MHSPDRNTVDIRGVNVRYDQTGEGPVVVLVHGLGASVVTWRQNIAPLAAAGFTVLALDLPGHGDSDKPDRLGYDPVSMAGLVKEFLDALGVDRISLVGSSVGGLIAGLIALEHPTKVDRLVMVATGAVGKRVSGFLRIVSMPVLGDLLFRPWLHQKLGMNKRIFFRPPPCLDEVMLEVRRVQSLPGARRAALRSIRANINYFGSKTQREIVDRLKESPVPLMTIWGEKDIVVPHSQSEFIRRELPNSVVQSIPACGQWPQMEKADEFNSLVTGFLKDPTLGHLGAAGAVTSTPVPASPEPADSATPTLAPPSQ